MAGLQPLPAAGKVNGLQRPVRFRGRPLRLPTRHSTSAIAMGAGLYAVALVFPLVFRQVSLLALAAAFGGTAILLWGLHVRWSRPSPASP